MNESHTVPMHTFRRFIPRYLDIPPGRVEVYRLTYARLEKNVVNRPDATADVEQRVAVQHVSSQLLDQAAGIRERPAAPETSELFFRFRTIELMLDSFTGSARHSIS